MTSPTTQLGQALSGGYYGGTAAPLDIVNVPTKSIVLQDEWKPTAADYSRKARMLEAIKAYNGDLPKPLKIGRDGIDDNIRTNRIKPFVRTKRSLLFGKPLKMTIDEDEGDDDGAGATSGGGGGKKASKSPLQDWLDDWLRLQHFTIFCKELKQNGALCGSPFWKLVEGDTANQPRLVLIDPTQMTVITDPQDWSIVIAYVQDYQLTDPTTGNLVDHRHIEYRENAQSTSWQIVDKERVAGQQYWGAPDEAVWPYPWSPIHACKNLPSACEWWGEPDVDDDLIQLNKSLNFVRSNTNRIIKLHAHPKTQLLGGASAKAMDLSPDNITGNLGPNGRLENLEMQSDLASSMAHANDLMESMDELASLPAVALSRLSAMPRGAMSGVTIAMLLWPAMNRTEDERELYGPALQDTCSHALELAGLGAGIEVHTGWQEVLPRDEQADWTVTQQQIEAGVSLHQVMMDHNLDYDEQLQWKLQEAQDKAAVSAANPSPIRLFNAGLGQPQLPPTSRGLQPQQMMPMGQQNATSDANEGNEGEAAS